MVISCIYSEEIKNSTHIGKWGMLHREYLKQKYPLALLKMIQNGELREYLTVLDKRADCRYRFLIKEIRQTLYDDPIYRHGLASFNNQCFTQLYFFQCSIIAYLCSLHLEIARLACGCTDHFVTDVLFYRDTFAGQGRLVNRRKAEGLSDDMKQISPMEWRAAMKAVTDKAEKIVKKEFVYILPKV